MNNKYIFSKNMNIKFIFSISVTRTIQSCQPKKNKASTQVLHEVKPPFYGSVLVQSQSQQPYVFPPATCWISSVVLSSALVQAPSSVLVPLKAGQLVHRSCRLVLVACCARPQFSENSQAKLPIHVKLRM